MSTGPTEAGAFAALGRVRAASRLLKALATLGAIGVLGAGIAFVAMPDWFDSLIPQAFPELAPGYVVTPVKRAGMLALMAVPFAAVLFGLWHVRLLFGAYERGEVFTETAARHIRLVGLAMAANAIAAVIVHSLGSILLTYDSAPGTRQLSIALGSDTYLLLLTGGLLVVIGWIMGEAARLADENRQIV